LHVNHVKGAFAPVSWWGRTMGSVKSVLTGIWVAVAAVTLSAEAAQATTVLTNSVIGTIRDNPKNNVPDEGFGFVFQALNQPIQEDRGIAEFDISGLTLPVGQAVLNLTQVGSMGDGIMVDVYGYTGNGILELSDFLLGTLITSFTVPVGAGSAINVDVTNFINATSGFAGFNLRLPNIERESVQFVLDGPTLTIDAVQVLPEPGTLAVLGFGLLGLGLVRRRRR